jgi:hypothetical protein
MTTGQKNQGTLITYTPCNIAVAWSPIILRLSSLSDGSRRHSLGRRGIFTLGEKLGVQYMHQEKWTRIDDAEVAEAQRSTLGLASQFDHCIHARSISTVIVFFRSAAVCT